MPILRPIITGVRNLINRVDSLFQQNHVARYITVSRSDTGFTIPDPNAPLPISDRHIQSTYSPGLASGSLPVIIFRTTPVGSASFSVRLNTTRLTQHTSSDADLVT